jgi:ketosteroid isomerase-like protein
MAAEDEVRQASERFYAALTGMVNGDPGPLIAAWGHDGDVTAMHPIGERDEGWERVRATFEQVGALASGGQVRLRDRLIRAGTDLAYEVGVEEGEATLAGERIALQWRVTNIYRREGGVWKVVHHHTDASPAMNDLLRRLQAPSQ